MEPRIEILDLDFRHTAGAIGAFLVVGDQGPVLVETGPGSTLPTLFARLRERGHEPGDVRNVLVTHIHFDHAGAAGWWANQGARIFVHPNGAPHLVDPSKLIASASRIYGDQMGPLWGDILAAPVDRVTTVRDGQTIEVEGLRFVAIETPGHANHHHVFRLGDVAFTGDAAGIRMPGTDWIDLPAPPPEFDLERWKASVERLRAAGFERLYRTHFGPAEDVLGELDRLEQLLEETAARIRGYLDRGLKREEMVADFGEWVRRRGVEAGADEAALHAYEIANPRDMSVDGVVRYWRKRSEREAEEAASRKP